MSTESPKEFIIATEEARTLPANELLTGRGFITGKSGAGKSVLEGTIVYTENGRKPIESVEAGEKVLSLNKHDYQQEYREVLATLEHESDELLRITLEDGTELVGTKDHSFLTVDDHEIVPIRGDELEKGTWFPLARQLPSTVSVTRIDLAEYATPSRDLDINEQTIRSGQKTDDRYLHLDFAAGKVLGLYLAEGSLDSRLTVQISNIDDSVRAFLGENGFKVYERTCNRAFKPFSTFVEEAFGRGAGEKELPNWVFNAPEQFKAGILSGYFDGDGTVGNTLAVVSKSPALIAGIKELLRHFGVSSTLTEKFTIYNGKERRFQRLRVDSFSLTRLSENLELSVPDKAAALDRAVERIADGEQYNAKDKIPGFGPVLNEAAREQAWTTRESEFRSRGASAHLLTRKQKAGRTTYNHFIDELVIEGRAKTFGRSDIQWKRIVDIEELDETRTVYDLDVQLNDNFIADGVFVHNSNSMSVIAEELLDGNYNLLIVDTDGEYFGLKEKYKLLHVGATDRCDVTVSPDHAEKIADIALKQNLPVILDVSGFHKADVAKELIEGVVSSLFVMENELRKPFLLIVEEMQEYLPQSGGKDDLSKLLLRVAKRGRKRGLGLCGLSQRPSAVDKDFITQCDWMVWHRLTWETDVDVVESILGRDIADEIPELGNGEAFLMTDWDETVERVQFRQKTTFDAGATPGLEGYERPDLTTIGDDLITDLLGETDDIELSDHPSVSDDSEQSEPTPVSEESLPTPQRSSSTTETGDSLSVEPDIAVEDQLNLVVTQLESDPPETDDPDELKRLLEDERKRNEILEDEIRELKTIIENIQQTTASKATDSPNNTAEETASSQLFTEHSPDGPAGVIVETGLLVTYLGLRTANAIKSVTSTILERSRPVPNHPQTSTPHGYPITLDHETNHYQYLARKYAIPVSAFLLVLIAIGVGWTLLGP